MADRSHLSIGEVLSLLREEFPDVTISKIRFLESQGLVDPERTPSGYRKFYDHDIERLRWILRQQRENFLPLKVIRGRLTAEGGVPVGGDSGSGQPPAGGGSVAVETDPPPEAAGGPPGAGRDTTGAPPGGGTARVHRETSPAAGHDRSTVPPAAAPAAGAPSAQAGEQRGQRPATGDRVPAGAPSTVPTEAARPAAPAAAREANGVTQAAGGGPARVERPPQPTGRHHHGDEETFTLEELAVAAGLGVADVAALQEYGLVSPASVAGVAYFDREALAVARAAAGFARYGVEARHLRAWRNAADREASLFEQVVLPLLKQRNPQARQQAATMLEELSAAGSQLHAALLRRALKSIG